MTAREALEASLQRSWSVDDLHVYVDCLLGEGDPRGELIAHDLHHAPTTPSQLHAPARLAALARWLGELAATAAPFVRLGFLETPVDHDGDPALLRAAGPYVRAVGCTGSADQLRATIAALVASPRPWLRSLRLERAAGRRGGEPTIDVALAERLIAATPHLAELSLDGGCAIEGFVHPGVRRAAIAGADALAAFTSAPPPALAALDLAFHDAWWSPYEGSDELAELPAARFGALAELDLSRNERGFGHPERRGGELDAIAYLTAPPRGPALATLRLPSLRSDADLARLLDAVAPMASLQRLAIARGYARHAGLLEQLVAALPGIEVSAPAWWPWSDDLVADHWLVVWLGDVGYRAQPWRLAQLMEREFDAMPPAAREAWTTVWRAIEAGGRCVLPVTVLDAALDAISDDDERLDQLAVLARAIVAGRSTAAAEATVELELREG